MEMLGSCLELFGYVNLGYTESKGNEESRRMIAQMYSSVLPGQVVVLTSPVEGICLTMQALLNRDDEVITLGPAYDALSNVAEHICHRVVPWKLSPGDGR